MSTLLRFVPWPNQTGFFTVASKLRDGGDMRESDQEELVELLQWFDNHLTEPDRFVHTSSKGWYRRDTIAFSWFRDEAKQCIDRAWRIVRMLERYGVQIEIKKTTRPGYVTYEDENQVVAIPFAD